MFLHIKQQLNSYFIEKLLINFNYNFKLNKINLFNEHNFKNNFFRNILLSIEINIFADNKKCYKFIYTINQNSYFDFYNFIENLTIKQFIDSNNINKNSLNDLCGYIFNKNNNINEFLSFFENKILKYLILEISNKIMNNIINNIEIKSSIENMSKLNTITLNMQEKLEL